MQEHGSLSEKPANDNHEEKKPRLRFYGMATVMMFMGTGLYILADMFKNKPPGMGK